MFKNWIKLSVLWLVIWMQSIGSCQSNTDIQLADMYFNKKEYAKAVLYYQRLYDNYPSPLYYQRLLASYLANDQLDLAEDLVNKHLKSFPKQEELKVDAYHVLVLQEGGKADKYFQKEILKNLSVNRSEIITISNALSNKKYFSEALQVLQKGEELSPYIRLYYEKAAVYGMMGDYENMTALYVGILNSSPSAVSTVKIYLTRFLNVDTDPQKALLLRKVLLKQIQSNPEQAVFKELLIWSFVQLKEFKLAFVQLKAVDKKYGGAKEALLDLAFVCLQNENLNLGIEIYDYLLGSDTSGEVLAAASMGKLRCRFEWLVKGGAEDPKALKKDLNDAMYEYGYTQNDLYLMRAKLQAYYLNEGVPLIASLNDTLEVFKTNPLYYNELKLIIGDVYLKFDDLWEAELQYNQVYLDNKDDEIGHKAKYKSAKIAFYRGDFSWCQEQLKVLKAASSKLIANDALSLSVLISDHVGLDSNEYPLQTYAAAELLFEQENYDAAQKAFSEMKTLFKGQKINEVVLWNLSEIAFKKSNYSESLGYLNELINQYPDGLYADDAWFKKARIYDYALNQPEEAVLAYEKIVLSFDDSIFVVPARERFRNLKNKNNDNL